MKFIKIFSSDSINSMTFLFFKRFLFSCFCHFLWNVTFLNTFSINKTSISSEISLFFYPGIDSYFIQNKLPGNHFLSKNVIQTSTTIHSPIFPIKMDPNDEINSDVNLKSKRNPDFYRSILSTNQSSFLEIQKNKNSFENQLKEGKQLFFANCNVCHIGGKNLIIPEKNLKKETLEINGMNTVNAIVYQIINGKNGMPAFGGRLTELEIQEIATYVLEEANISFK